MVDIFDVLSDPTRRDLLARLLDGERSVGALVEETGLTQPTVSKHLKVLRDQGLVAVREEAQHRFYRVDPAPLAEVNEWLGAFLPAPAAVGASARVPAAPSSVIPWSGVGTADQLGRAAATTVHRAKQVLDQLREATAQARELLGQVPDQARGALTAVTDRVKQVLPVAAGQQ